MKHFITLLILVCFALVLPITAFAQGESTIKESSTGDEVALIQTRLCDLGYLNYRPTGKFSAMTVEAVKNFQQQNGIAPDGQVGDVTYQTLFSDTAKRAPVNARVKKVSGPGYSGSVQEKGELSSWENINPLIPVGTEFSVQDYNSGVTFTLIRTGGQNCAQVTTLSPEDYATYRKSFGNADTWEHRAVLVRIGEQNYAASLFGMPTGGAGEHDSGMAGHTFLYFNNSKTDVSSLADEEHALAIARAGTRL